MQVEELEEAGESSKLKDQHATVQKRKRGTREEEEVRPYIHISARNRPRVFALGENGKESVRVCMCERMWLSPHSSTVVVLRLAATPRSTRQANS